MRRLLLLCLLVPLAGCGASASVGKSIDEDKIEQEIASVLKEQTGVTVDEVDCPDDISTKAGTDFTCAVEGEDGSKVTSTGQITEGERFKASTPVINTTKIQTVITQGIKRQAGVDATVDCPDLVQLKAAATSTCKATVGDTTRDVTVTQKDATGNVSYKLEPTS